MNKKVWYVTGASKGLGLALVQKLLSEGCLVAATSRNQSDLEKVVGKASDSFLPLTVDLQNEGSVGDSISKTVNHFGKLDVVVNNAGYGLAGALEELSDAESRENFNVNVFGTLNVIRHAMPVLRQQQSGHIFNVASIGGFTGGFPGFGIYCATKFAVHGLTESLAHEVKEFNVKATVVMPGYFRTDFLTSGSFRTPAHELDEYKTVRDVQNAHTGSYNGNQQGNPEKAAGVFIAVASMPEPPIHLFLGPDAYELADAKMQTVKKDMEQVKALATATSF